MEFSASQPSSHDGRQHETLRPLQHTVVHQSPSADVPPSPTVSCPSGPKRIGRYELRGELGRGRYGVVHLAWDSELQRLVALKVPQFDLDSEPSLRERFRGEALAAGKLSHSGIVQVFDVGQHEGIDYLSMAYVEGETLSQLLKSGPLRADEAARLVIQIAGAMQHAHELGVIHRDLKPSNILLDKQGMPRVTDFGLARRLSDSDLRATATGQILGSPAYMSPEQAAGKTETTAACDIYSLGVILYELVTGRPPLQAATFAEAMEFVLKRDALPPSKLNPSVPREIDAIALKCLEKSAAARYESAADLAADLQRFLDGRPIRARALGPVRQTFRWCRRHPTKALLSVAGVVVLGLLFAVGSVYVKLQHSDQLAGEQRKLAEAHRYVAAVSRARNQIAQRQPGWTDRAMQQIRAAAANESAVAEPLDLRSLAVVCLSGFDVREVATIETKMSISEIAYSHDGSLLAAAESKGTASCRIQIFDAQTRQLCHTLHVIIAGRNFARLVLQRKKFQDGVRALAFSSDDRYLAVGMRYGSILFFDLESPSKPVTMLEAGDSAKIDKLAFSADGKSVFALTENHDLFRWPDWRQGGAPEKPLGDGVHGFASSATGGTLALQSMARESLAVYEPTTFTPHRYSVDAAVLTARDSSFTMNEDGSLIAGETADGIRVYETLTGRLVRRMIDDSVTDQVIVDDLSLTGDGRLLTAFDRDGVVRFFDVGSGRQLLRLPLGRHDLLSLALDPTKRRVAASADKSIRIWELVVPEARVGFNSPAEFIDDVRFSPNSKRIATTTTMGGCDYHQISRLNIFDVATSHRLDQRTGGFEFATFSPTASCLAWRSNEELAWHNLFGTTVWSAAENAPLKLQQCLPIAAATTPAEFQFIDVEIPQSGSVSQAKSSSVENKQPFVERVPDLQGLDNYAWRIQMRGDPLRLAIPPVDIVLHKQQLATLLLSLKIDADDSFEPPFTASVHVPGHDGANCNAAQWLQTECDGGYKLFSLAIALPVGPIPELELRLTPSPRLRTIWLDQIHYVALDTDPSVGPSRRSAELLTEELGFSPAGDRVWGNVSNEARSWSWPAGTEQTRWSNPSHLLSGAGNIRSVNPGSKGILVGTRDARVYWLDPTKGTAITHWPGPGNEVVATALCESVNLAIAGGDNGVIVGFHIPDGSRMFELPAHEESIVALAATPDASRLVTAAADRTLKLWRKQGSSYELYCDLPSPTTSVAALRLSADGQHLAVLGTKTRNLEVWHLDLLLSELLKLKIE